MFWDYLLQGIWHSTTSIIPVSLALAGGGSTGHHSHNNPSCKAVIDGDDWPSSSEWAALNSTVDGRLLVPTPPGAVCHPGQGSYDPVQCPVIQSLWHTYGFHEEDPVSNIINNFNNDTCLPEPDSSCSPVGYPRFVVNATEVEHVQAAINFAKEHNVRLIVKATGHDFIGRSVAPNSLSIWTHHMKGLEFHNSFQPKGCKKRIEVTAVTTKAGGQMYDLYSALDARNQTVTGGGGKTVGIGGYVTGAGHSILSGKYGLAADNVLEVGMVTPDGKVVVANECQNEDLFWAIRGGGGSTFGVLTSITIRTYPTPTMPNLLLPAFFRAGDPQLLDLWSYMLSQMHYLESSGVYGYVYFLPYTEIPIGNETVAVAGFYGTFLMPGAPNVSAFEPVFAPLMAYATKTFTNLTLLPNTTMYDTFLDWFDTNYDQSSTGIDLYLASRLLDDKSLASENADNVKEMLLKTVEGNSPTAFMAHMIAGPGVWDAEPRGGGNAVLPAWRRTVVHAVNSVQFSPLNATAKKEAKEKVESLVAPMRELAPDTGAYLNEANANEPDFQKTFWGDNYPRLLAIKKHVDPDDVFWCTPCVGNEGWEEVGDQLCKV